MRCIVLFGISVYLCISLPCKYICYYLSYVTLRKRRSNSILRYKKPRKHWGWPNKEVAPRPRHLWDNRLR